MAAACLCEELLAWLLLFGVRISQATKVHLTLHLSSLRCHYWEQWRVQEIWIEVPKVGPCPQTWVALKYGMLDPCQQPLHTQTHTEQAVTLMTFAKQ